MVDILSTNASTARLDRAVLPAGDLLGSFTGRLEFDGDHDWIGVNLVAGEFYDIFLSLQLSGVPDGDAIFQIYDAAGNAVVNAEDDDSGVGLNSYLNFEVLTSGLYFIDVGEFGNGATGEYNLVVSNVLFSPTFLTDDPDSATGNFDALVGGRGNDIFNDADDAIGEQANDRIIGNSAENYFFGGLGNDFLDGKRGNDILFGDAGDDQLFGDIGDDQLYGGDRNDRLVGGLGADQLFGGASTDVLTGGQGKDRQTGGIGTDKFDFNLVTEIGRTATERDIIFDFRRAEADKIDFSTIDANGTAAGNTAFKFIGVQPFHGVRGELRYTQVDRAGTAGDYTLVSGDIDGNRVADFNLEVKGLIGFRATDFIL